MDRRKYHFGIGLVVGIVLAGLFFQFYAPRYTTVESQAGMIKQDKWSGDTWKLVGDQWKKITDDERDWKNVDQSLHSAFQATVGGEETTQLLKQFKEKYPELKGVSDAELLKRIRTVYSQEILTRTYLENVINPEGK